jgi:hypothetical protein
MSRLGAKRLGAVLDAGRRFGSLGIDDQVLDTSVADLRARSPTFYSDAPEVAAFRTPIEEPLAAIRPERRALLDQFDLFVLHQDICLCKAEAGSDTHRAAVILSRRDDQSHQLHLLRCPY